MGSGFARTAILRYGFVDVGLGYGYRLEATPQLFACAIERSRIKANQGLNWAYLDKTQHKLIAASICFYLLNRHCVPQATNQGVVGSDPAGRAKNQAYRPDA